MNFPKKEENSPVKESFSSSSLTDNDGLRESIIYSLKLLAFVELKLNSEKVCFGRKEVQAPAFVKAKAAFKLLERVQEGAI